jgi:hypothetical protein
MSTHQMWTGDVVVELNKGRRKPQLQSMPAVFGAEVLFPGSTSAAETVVPATELQRLSQAVRSRRDNERIHLTRVAWAMRLATVLPLP